MSFNDSPEPLPAGSPDLYRQLQQEVSALLQGERDWLANLANLSSLLQLRIPDLNWVGFYLWRGNELVLGPFQGKPACVRIASGRGVCGSAVEQRKTLLVPDVHAFPGHIACDAASASELVILLILGNRLLGVLDLDSPTPGRFSEPDQLGLEEVVQRLILGTDWPDLF